MDNLIKLILTLPLEKILNLYCLKDYLSDAYKKEILEVLLLSTRDKNALPEVESKSDLFADPIFSEIERFNTEIIKAWDEELLKRSMQTSEKMKKIAGDPEDCRLDFFVYLLKRSEYKKQFPELQKKIEILFNLYTFYDGGLAASVLTSLGCALSQVIDSTLLADQPFFPLVEAAFQKKYVGEVQKNNEQKIEMMKVKLDHFSKIKVLCDLNFELNLLLGSLQAYLNEEFVEKNLSEKIRSLYDFFSSVQKNMDGKNITERLEYFYKCFDDEIIIKPVGRENVDLTVKIAVARINSILEYNRSLLVSKSSWGLTNLIAIPASFIFCGLFGSRSAPTIAPQPTSSAASAPPLVSVRVPGN